MLTSDLAIFSSDTDEVVENILCNRYTAKCLDLINKNDALGELTYKKDLLPICNPAALNVILEDLNNQKLVSIERITDPQTKYILKLTDKGRTVANLYRNIRLILESDDI